MMTRTFIGGAVVAFLSVVLLASGCATTSDAPPSATTTPVSSSNYLIGPGDTLRIFVWRYPEVSTEVPVRPDGKISMPLVEDMQAVGKTSNPIGQRPREGPRHLFERAGGDRHGHRVCR